MNPQDIREKATALADAADADVFFYNGSIDPRWESEFVKLGGDHKRRTNVILALCTRGGLPDAAYRMARFLQQNYKKFSLLICGKCKSSGTLIAVGAHELIMGDRGELGPLDIQLGKKDELWENDSGLTVLSSITELESKAYDLFENGFVKLKLRTEGRMTTKTATAIATELAIGMISPIVSQIDPMHVGEVSRAMKVAKEYGERLSKGGKNLEENTLETLINGYPSHGFVIDRTEAKELFKSVRPPNELESAMIGAFVEHLLSNPISDALTFEVSRPKKEANDAPNQQAGGDANPVEPAPGDGAVQGADQGHQGAGEQGGGNVVPIEAGHAA
jgi:hypothetical protein